MLCYDAALHTNVSSLFCVLAICLELPNEKCISLILPKARLGFVHFLQVTASIDKFEWIHTLATLMYHSALYDDALTYDFIIYIQQFSALDPSSMLSLILQEFYAMSETDIIAHLSINTLRHILYLFKVCHIRAH